MLTRRGFLGFALAAAAGAPVLEACGMPPIAKPQTAPSQTGSTASRGLRAAGTKLIDGSGREFRLTGVNWFGFETSIFAPHGLWSRRLDDMLDQISQSGFNSIRLPFCNQALEPDRRPASIDYSKNPDLRDLTSLQVMDRLIAAAASRGLKVLLDRHAPTADARTELWYTSEISESRWIEDWVGLAHRYRDQPAVIGADLHNEPHGAATWGDGNSATDWRLAAERAGNAILAANPDWLIVVEGIETYGGDHYWWGGNLLGAKKAPVRLSLPDRLVYSAHDYGPEVYMQRWFQAPDFPHNLASLWMQHWGGLKDEGVAPVLLGEFGGRSVGADQEGTWQRTIVAYLRDHGISYTYWCWNPDSGDTGGILKDDWQTVDKAKLDLLATYQWPRGA